MPQLPAPDGSADGSAAVIIPHFNDSIRLERCLTAIAPQLAGRADTEVVVVDNGSTGAHAAMLGDLAVLYPRIRFLTEHRKGAAEARNRGVAETSAARIFFLDCDCLPADDWLATAHRVAPRADLVGGTITVFDETPAPRSGAQAFEAVFAFDNRGYIETKGFSVTANLLTRRDVFLATGPLIAGLSEDLDWCHRARAKGFTLVHEDRLRVGHPSRADWAELSRKWRRVTKESFGLTFAGRAAPDLRARAKWSLRAMAMPVSILAHAPRVLRHQGLSAGEKLAGLAMLARLRLARMGWMLAEAATGKP